MNLKFRFCSPSCRTAIFLQLVGSKPLYFFVSNKLTWKDLDFLVMHHWWMKLENHVKQLVVPRVYLLCLEMGVPLCIAQRKHLQVMTLLQRARKKSIVVRRCAHPLLRGNKVCKSWRCASNHHGFKLDITFKPLIFNSS